jgi:hypothetical protein
MTKLLNTTFDSKQATGRILTTLSGIANRQEQNNTGTVNIANDICQFIIHDDFQVLAGTKFTSTEFTAHCQRFAEICLGIPEADYSKEDKFKQSKKVALREAMKIAQVLMSKSLYADLDETKIKRVSNQGRMMIASPNIVVGTDRFNKDSDLTVRLGKQDLLAVYSSVYGSAGSGKKVSEMSKSYADFLNHLKGTIVKVPTKVGGGKLETVKLVLPEGVDFETIMTWEEEINTAFALMTVAFLNSVTPEQAVKKGYISRIDEHPNFEKKVQTA